MFFFFCLFVRLKCRWKSGERKRLRETDRQIEISCPDSFPGVSGIKTLFFFLHKKTKLECLSLERIYSLG
jgi:hypothetical protein